MGRSDSEGSRGAYGEIEKEPSLSYNKYDFSSRDVANTQNFGKLGRNIIYYPQLYLSKLYE